MSDILIHISGCEVFVDVNTSKFWFSGRSRQVLICQTSISAVFFKKFFFFIFDEKRVMEIDQRWRGLGGKKVDSLDCCHNLSASFCSTPRWMESQGYWLFSRQAFPCCLQWVWIIGGEPCFSNHITCQRHSLPTWLTCILHLFVLVHVCGRENNHYINA